MAIEKFPKIFWRLLRETRRKNFTKFLIEVCIMNYEEKYWELREAMDRAWDEYMRDPYPIVKIEYDYAYDRFDESKVLYAS